MNAGASFPRNRDQVQPGGSAIETVAIETRWSSEADAEALAAVHEAAWRYAYAGLIPGLALEQMIRSRGADYWRASHRRGARALVLTLDGQVLGYAAIGRARGKRFPGAGEIYELYLDPAAHGSGLGRRLFDAARKALRARGLKGLVVWCLEVNELGCRFYDAVGGVPAARSSTRLGGTDFALIGYRWR